MKSTTKLFLIISIGLTSLLSIQAYKEDFFEISKNLDIFSSLYKNINIYYVDNTKPGELMKIGIDAMLESLDPYTNFIAESDIEDYRFMTTGQYGGIGSVIRKKDKYVVIAEPYEDSPSLKAGLKAGDKILKIDGKDIKGKNVSDISSFLKGEPNTKVLLEIDRMGSDSIFNIEVIREEIKVKDVPYHGLVSPKTGYIKLNSFTQTASKEVSNAFQELKDDHQIENLILDLRGNGGGLLREAVNIVNLFVKKGTKVVETRGKIKDWDRIHKTSNEALDQDIKLAILTDGGSASASEIVSGAIQDLDRGIVVGDRTYGKGLVQQTFDVSYNSKVKVTVAKYYIPSGRCIQRLDYSNKDAKGKAIQVADSLTQEFKTTKGRVVKDGAGIAPDIFVEKPEIAELIITLMRKNIFFDYATDFVLKNSSIAKADQFQITDEQYQDFVAYAKQKGLDYETKLEKELHKLEKISEKQADQHIVKDIQDLKNHIADQKEKDFTTYKSFIQRVLEQEIVSRYYYQSGKVQNALSKDEDVLKAIEILNDAAQYSAIFEPSYLPNFPKEVLEDE